MGIEGINSKVEKGKTVPHFVRQINLKIYKNITQ